jgi:hypothetical protein
LGNVPKIWNTYVLFLEKCKVLDSQGFTKILERFGGFHEFQRIPGFPSLTLEKVPRDIINLVIMRKNLSTF